MRRETYTSENDNVRVSQLLREFSEDPGKAVNVFRDCTAGLTSCITFQTAFMRRMTQKFPEAFCIDATNGTNINRYDFNWCSVHKLGTNLLSDHQLIYVLNLSLPLVQLYG
ncbi:hypothetical protein PHMEG_00031389 [Phytophthora megakarya]|uniref:ZSWIM1/3 RNaseH-like domain-containing protein n=1 Tax=Phytophthora megakarya TaxID=4795 RepID=A0A225UY82_9STRA|nr:hypothetical protein PHMEG_00031389 [Phytophthora megakarya]